MAVEVRRSPARSRQSRRTACRTWQGVGGRTKLVVGGEGADPVQVQAAVIAAASVAGSLAVGLSAGILVLDLSITL